MIEAPLSHKEKCPIKSLQSRATCRPPPLPNHHNWIALCTHRFRSHIFLFTPLHHALAKVPSQYSLILQSRSLRFSSLRSSPHITDFIHICLENIYVYHSSNPLSKSYGTTRGKHAPHIAHSPATPLPDLGPRRSALTTRSQESIASHLRPRCSVKSFGFIWPPSRNMYDWWRLPSTI